MDYVILLSCVDRIGSYYFLIQKSTKEQSDLSMFQAVVVFGIIVLSLAAVWSIFRAIALVLRNQVREGIPYLLAFFLLIYFDYYLMRLLPFQ